MCQKLDLGGWSLEVAEGLATLANDSRSENRGQESRRKGMKEETKIEPNGGWLSCVGGWSVEVGAWRPEIGAHFLAMHMPTANNGVYLKNIFKFA